MLVFLAEEVFPRIYYMRTSVFYAPCRAVAPGWFCNTVLLLSVKLTKDSVLPPGDVFWSVHT